MRTRNADSPKSGAAKKTPATKKAAAAGMRGFKSKQANPKPSSAAATSAPEPELQVEKPVVLVLDGKSPAKKPGEETPALEQASAEMIKEEQTPKPNPDPKPVPKAQVDEEPEEVINKNGEEQQIEEDVEPTEEEAGEEESGAGEGEEGDEDKGVRIDEQMDISDLARVRKIKKEQEVFVGGLDRDAVEEDLMKVFEKVGEVVEIRLHKDFSTNKNKGFAFVKFAYKEQAAKALSELKSPMICGKRCGVAPSEDNDTLFLGNICNTWTKEAIKNKLKDYGIDGVEKITLVADSQHEGVSRGFAFLEFSCHADAMLAYKRLQKPDVVFGHPERTAKVAFAEPLHEPDPEVMGQVKSVFVDGLPPYWDEDRVKDQFKVYGEIECVALARNMSKAKRKDFGFVNFTTHEAAVACANTVNDTELGDGNSKMKARARLANPFPKTQAVKGGMSGGYRIGHLGLGSGGFGFGRGFIPHRAGFHGGRGFLLRGCGRSGRFSFPTDNYPESSYTEFQGGRSSGFRGGRRGSMSLGHNAFNRGRGRGFSPRRPPVIPGEFDGSFGSRNSDEDPYFYGNGGYGIKRQFAIMEHDPGYLDPGSHIRRRYDHPNPLSGGARYRDFLGMPSNDYYGSDYGDSTYSSLYRGEHSRGSYFY